MATAVFFHAHPDDEAIATGGTMARAAAHGHRVVLVLATRGELGEPVDGVLGDGELLHHRRSDEAVESAEVLGAARVEFLGYVDSGMMGEPTNDAPDCFWQAGVDEAAERLARVLREEHADVLVVYDSHGGYGHPDHIQVHRVGHRAAELAGGVTVYESTMNRDHIRRGMERSGLDGPERAEMAQAIDSGSFGSPESVITHAVDVTGYLDQKRTAMRVHASQIAEDAFFLSMPDEVFAQAFGTEWYIDPRSPRGDGPFVPALAPLD